MTIKVIYVAGAYRAENDFARHLNCRKAELAALKLWTNGWAVICPQKNTEHFDGTLVDGRFLEGDIEILKRCDAIYMLNNFESSDGAKKELQVAKDIGLEIIYQ